METLKELKNAFATSQISRSTYFRKLKKIRDGDSLKRRKGSGRPRKITRKFIQKTVAIALRNPHISGGKIAIRLQLEDDISLRETAVQRTLKRSGITKNGRKIVF